MSDDSDYESGSDGQEESGGMSIEDAYRIYAEEHDGQYPITQKQFLSFVNVGRGNGRWQLKFADVRSYWDRRDPVATSKPAHLDVVNRGMYGEEDGSDAPAMPQKRMSARDLSNEAYAAVASEAALAGDGADAGGADDDDEYDQDEDDDEPAQPAQPAAASDDDDDEDDEDEPDEDDDEDDEPEPEPEPEPAAPAEEPEDDDEDDEDDDEDDEDDDEDEDSD